MTVWVLEGEIFYESSTVLGVFSSEEAAQNYKEQRATALGYDDYTITAWDVDSVLIELKE